jgi:hypothetical protein
VSVLLANDLVELYPPGQPDAHGWAEPATAASWTGQGNLQLGQGTSDPRATDRGGHGPFDPAAVQLGTLWLPVEAEPAEGGTALVRGQRYALSQVRLVTDPAASGLDCWLATVSGLDGWNG